jgi:hypothetical protein
MVFVSKVPSVPVPRLRLGRSVIALSKTRLIAELAPVNHKSIKVLIVLRHVALQPSKSLIMLIIPVPIINLIVSALTLNRPGFLLVAIARSTHANMQSTTETV